MKPKIDETIFGSITVEKKSFKHDIIIRLDGEIGKRKKKLSKKIYSTSHMISLEEAKYVYEKGADKIIIGTGHHSMVKLSDEATEYFKKKNCAVSLQPTKDAIKLWNNSNSAAIGLFHVTC